MILIRVIINFVNKTTLDRTNGPNIRSNLRDRRLIWDGCWKKTNLKPIVGFLRIFQKLSIWQQNGRNMICSPLAELSNDVYIVSESLVGNFKNVKNECQSHAFLYQDLKIPV